MDFQRITQNSNYDFTFRLKISKETSNFRHRRLEVAKAFIEASGGELLAQSKQGFEIKIESENGFEILRKLGDCDSSCNA